MNTMHKRICVSLMAGLGLAPPLVAQDFSKVELQTTALADNLYVIAGGGGNVAVSVGEDGVLLVDDSYTELKDKLDSAVKAITKAPIRMVINTHWHFDHVGGNQALATAGAIIVAHDSVRKRMSEDQHLAGIDRHIPASPVKALPLITFADGLTLHWNGDEVRVMHLPPAHTDGDSMVYFASANVLHVGDVWFNGMYPFIDINAGGSLAGIVAAGDRALAQANEQTKIIPGHGAVSNSAELKRYRDVLATIDERVRTLAASGKSREEIIAAKPSQQFDEQWSGSWRPDTWIGIVYDGMSKK